jgi:hypothetical protein
MIDGRREQAAINFASASPQATPKGTFREGPHGLAICIKLASSEVAFERAIHGPRG